MYTHITKSVTVNVEPVYLEDESEPDRDYFLWAYTISIENQGRDVIRLRSRHWRITDRNGRVQEVRGEGVVGEQPVLSPGESFEYTSGVPLSTPSGIMVGAYVMETEAGESFTVDIPAFSLDSPFDQHRVH
jgi:ApaG protein